ncbi:unnamed protein product [Diamesa tonsa]
MGNFFSSSSPTSSYNDRPAVVQRNNNLKYAVVISENPEVLYYSNQVIKQHNSVKTFAGQFEQRKVTIKRITKNYARIVKHETDFLEKFDCHPNILRYFFKTHDDTFFYIISEHYETTLDVYFKDNVYKNIPVQKVMQDVSKGVDFLNQLSIIHLNINPMNVVVARHQDKFIAKLTSFTFAHKLEKQTNLNLTVVPGIEGFQAPEFLLHKQANIKSDIYSMGCLFFYLISNGYKMQQVTFPGQQQIISSRLSLIQQTKSRNILGFHLITEMLRYYEDERISTVLVLEHPFFFTTQQNFMLILDVYKLIETKNDAFRTLLFKNSRTVIGHNGNWKDHVEDSVINILMKIRNTHLSRIGCEFGDDQPKGTITNLITQIRNSIVHSNDDLIPYLGKTTDSYLNYWIDKFPRLIIHLYGTMKVFKDLK